MKRTLLILSAMWMAGTAYSQGKWDRKFEQLGTELPSPNSYRTASGAPGKDYWQQRADYNMEVELDDQNQKISGKETIIYFNNSPDQLTYYPVLLSRLLPYKNVYCQILWLFGHSPGLPQPPLICEPQHQCDIVPPVDNRSNLQGNLRF